MLLRSRRTVGTHQLRTRRTSWVMVEKRREMRGVRLTEEAHRGIDALVTRAGCTRTGFFEALGLAARSGSPIVWEQVIAEAIRIDRSRLSRR